MTEPILNLGARVRSHFDHTYFGSTYYQEKGTDSYAGMPYNFGSNARTVEWIAYCGTTEATTEPEGDGTYYPSGSFEPSYTGTGGDIVYGTFIYELFRQGSSDGTVWTSVGSGTLTFPGNCATVAATVGWATALHVERSGSVNPNGTTIGIYAKDLDSPWVTGNALSDSWSCSWSLSIDLAMTGHGTSGSFSRDDAPICTLNTNYTGLVAYGNIWQTGTPSSFSVNFQDNQTPHPAFSTTITAATTLTWHSKRHMDLAGSYKLDNLQSYFAIGPGTYGNVTIDFDWTINNIAYKTFSLTGSSAGDHRATQIMFEGTDAPYRFKLCGSYYPVSIPNHSAYAATTLGSAAGDLVIY